LASGCVARQSQSAWAMLLPRSLPEAKTPAPSCHLNLLTAPFWRKEDYDPEFFGVKNHTSDGGTRNPSNDLQNSQNHILPNHWRFPRSESRDGTKRTWRTISSNAYLLSWLPTVQMTKPSRL
jgi:hypothetical protein